MKYTTLIKFRRFAQIIFLGLFLFLLIKTEYRGSLQSAAEEIRIPFPVSIFLEADPLVGISNALSTHALYKGLIWSLVIIIPTFFLGRFFCGWVCPLGTINHFFSNLKSEKKRGKRLIESNRYKKWQTLKYYLLIAILVSAIFKSNIAGILDPIAFTIRSLALSIFPAINYGFTALLETLDDTDVFAFKLTAQALQLLIKDTLLSFEQPYFRQGFFLGLVFIFLLALNLRITRFWCRALCPLGALLGILSRWSILGMEKHPSHCEDCNICLLHCQGGDEPIPGTNWRKAECHLCFNCVGDCPESSIKFKLFPAVATTTEKADLKRRRVLTSIIAGAGMVPLLRSTTRLHVENHPRLIRPPGSLVEKDFLERCIRCGECMKVCPNNALHPTLFEAGIEGIWTPVLVPRIGYCEPSCVLCTQVCPTGAIWEITQAEKLGVPENEDDESEPKPPIKIGLAFFDRGRCLPWAMATECIVCEEWCPTSPKAIYLQPADVKDAQGNRKQVRQPYVDVEHCNGCGACEYACPVQDQPAIYVTSIGESRSKTNQILLQSNPPPPKT